MKSNNDEISFENEKEARILLEESRMRIDEIDNELCDLISERTSLAKGIVFSKQYLGMPIYDESREKVVHEKIEKLAKENDLDVDIIDQIVDMLTILSKNEQKKILRRNVEEYSTVSTKHLRNKIAGYVTRLVRLEQTQD